ncbi:hypothetical protein ACJX0J_019281, partial [Zea mays]
CLFMFICLGHLCLLMFICLGSTLAIFLTSDGGGMNYGLVYCYECVLKTRLSKRTDMYNIFSTLFLINFSSFLAIFSHLHEEHHYSKSYMDTIVNTRLICVHMRRVSMDNMFLVLALWGSLQVPFSYIICHANCTFFFFFLTERGKPPISLINQRTPTSTFPQIFFRLGEIDTTINTDVFIKQEVKEFIPTPNSPNPQGDIFFGTL